MKDRPKKLTPKEKHSFRSALLKDITTKILSLAHAHSLPSSYLLAPHNKDLPSLSKFALAPPPSILIKEGEGDSPPIFSSDPDKVGGALKEVWEPIFGSIRKSNPDALKELINSYENFPILKKKHPDPPAPLPFSFNPLPVPSPLIPPHLCNIPLLPKGSTGKEGEGKGKKGEGKGKGQGEKEKRKSEGGTGKGRENSLKELPLFPSPPPSALIDIEEFGKTFTSKNSSSPGPDGIPFLFYNVTYGMLKNLYLTLAYDTISTDVLIPGNFGDSDLYLIPKGTGNLSPLNFRPISVTSTIYRLITKYFSVDFRRFASNHISSEQRALLLDRTITSAVIDVRDTFLDRIHNMMESHLLQTDLRKAYDFLNREAIISILEKLNYPPHLINLSHIALRPSKSFIRVGRSKKDQELLSFSSVSGVKQGCPLAPYLYIITFDLFISKINPSLHPDILTPRAYMDDLAVLMKSRKPLGKIAEVFQRYSDAVGAEMNFDKCCILSFLDDEPISSLPPPLE